MTFKKIERKRLSEQIASEVEEAIISGVYRAGSTLPSEQRLAVQFGVSRNVVREAFKFLKERGLIDIQNGSGAYVCEPNAGAASDALFRYIRLTGAHESIEGLYEARRILEGNNARLAAERADTGNLEILKDCLARMKAALDGSIEKWSDADLAFHLGIARATHNPFLSILLEPLVDQLREVIAEGYLVPGATQKGLQAHLQIFDCIKKRNAEGAYQAIMEHLDDSARRVKSLTFRRE